MTGSVRLAVAVVAAPSASSSKTYVHVEHPN